MNFIEIIETDIPADAVILKTNQTEDFNSIVKLDEKEINELKIKKESISFFTINKNEKNPLKPEFTTTIYTLNNKTIEIIYESNDIKTLEEIEELIRNILI